MSSHVVFDRGPSPYFHGREEILETFSDYLALFKKEKRGTTFLIQGAPGAGKTALLDKISSVANKKGWEVAKIRIKDLYSPISMAQSLGKSYTIDEEYSAKIGIKFFEGGRVRNLAGHASVEQILEHLSPKRGLVLVLDEAQHIGKLKESSTEHLDAQDTLDMIHNGDVGRPVILLAAGLGTTERAFNSLGISRFGKKCIVQLSALDTESERAVIQDWLIEEGKVKGHLKVWIDAIAEQAHGWPQHIISYIEPALESIKSNNRQMTDEGLEYVLEKGAKSRQEYYDLRAHGIRERQRQLLAHATSDLPLGGTTEYEDLIDIIQQEYSQKEAEDLFNKALEQGIIDEHRSGRYGIPIPSMHTWLLSEYGRERIEIPREDVRGTVNRHSRDDEKGSSKWSQER